MKSRTRRIGLAIVTIVVVLVAARLMVAGTIQWYVNDRLDKSESYGGRVGDIDLNLLAGAYSIDDLEIVKTDGEVPVPLFRAEKVAFSLLWGALLDGALVGEAELFKPEWNIVDGSTEDSSQTGAEDEDYWLAVANDLFPLRIDLVTVHDGQLHFRNFESEPPVDVYLSSIEGRARNLTNSEDLSDSLVASIELQSKAMEQADLTANVQLDPRSPRATFDVNARLIGLPVMALDDFIKVYAPFDLEAGSVDVAIEMAVDNGQLTGYVKPVFHDIEVFKWREDVEKDKDNPLKVLWETFVGALSELLENQPRDQIASRVPLEGSLDDPEMGMMEAFFNILRNAFVEAFEANLEHSVTLDLDKDENEEEAERKPES